MQQKKDTHITQHQQYLDLIAAAEAIITQFEQGQLEEVTAKSQLKQAYRKIHDFEQSSFELMLSQLQQSMTIIINEFYTSPPPDNTRFMKILTQAVYVVSHLNENLDYLCPLLLKPSQVKFLLGLMNYLTDLGSLALLKHDQQAANLLTGFTANRLVPFLMVKIFMVTLPNEKSKKSLKLMSMNMTSLGEWVIQQHINVLFKTNQLEQAEQYLSKIEYHHASANHYKHVIPTEVEEYFQEQHATFKANLKANRLIWKKSIANVRLLQKELHVKTMPSLRYYLWANSAVHANPPKLSLALCYLNLAIDIFERHVKNTPPLAMYELYKIIAAKHVGAKQYSAAVTVYETMLQRYPHVLRLIPDFAKDTINMEKTLATLKLKAFQQLVSVWQTMDHTTINDVANIQFNEKLHRIIIGKNNITWLKILEARLQSDTISYQLDKVDLNIIILSPYHLSADDLQKYIENTELQFVNRECQLERRKTYHIQSKTKPKPQLDIITETQNPATFFHEPTSPKRIRPPRAAKTQLLANNTAAAKKPSKPANVETISWGDKFPLFHPTQGCVYPIPNPEIKNTSIPIGIFYGYIDAENLALLDTDLLEQFELILGRGKLVAKGDPHGIRAVSGELPAGSPYLFKINIHGQDYRLYGRKVADKTESGDMKILIAFDQAIRHDESLQLIEDHQHATLSK